MGKKTIKDAPLSDEVQEDEDTLDRLSDLLLETLETNSAQISWAEMLAKQGAKLCRTNKHGYSALHLSVISNNIDMVKTLVHLGADIYAEDPTHKTPMNISAELGHAEITGFLLDHSISQQENAK